MERSHATTNPRQGLSQAAHPVVCRLPLGARAVYITLCGLLPIGLPRRISQGLIAMEACVSEATVSRAMPVLVEFGLIDRGPAERGYELTMLALPAPPSCDERLANALDRLHHLRGSAVDPSESEPACDGGSAVDPHKQLAMDAVLMGQCHFQGGDGLRGSAADPSNTLSEVHQGSASDPHHQIGTDGFPMGSSDCEDSDELRGSTGDPATMNPPSRSQEEKECTHARETAIREDPLYVRLMREPTMDEPTARQIALTPPGSLDDFTADLARAWRRKQHGENIRAPIWLVIYYWKRGCRLPGGDCEPAWTSNTERQVPSPQPSHPAPGRRGRQAPRQTHYDSRPAAGVEQEAAARRARAAALAPNATPDQLLELVLALDAGLSETEALAQVLGQELDHG